jgi:predicted dehydrogenase
VTAPLRAFRVAVAGARRTRQGTGPFLASFLHAAGTKVVAVSASTEANARAAAGDLRAKHGIEAAPFSDALAMAREAPLDALVVATPAATHLPLLDAALSRGLHVLCERPFVLHEGDFPADAERLAAGFASAGRCLAVAAQWRHGLPAWMRLFPDARPRDARTFEMRLAPASAGEAMLADAMPHPLALLDHLYGAPEEPLRGLAFEVAAEDDVVVRFVHPGGRAGVACEVRLARVETTPRPLAFGFDGRLAHRRVAEPGYRASLRDGEGPDGREVALPDPLEAVVKDFVARVRRGPPFPADPTIAAGARRLRQVLLAWREGPGRGTDRRGRPTGPG